MKAIESDHLAGGSAREVKVVANGHCHREFSFAWGQTAQLIHSWQLRKTVEESKVFGFVSAVAGQTHSVFVPCECATDVLLIVLTLRMVE